MLMELFFYQDAYISLESGFWVIPSLGCGIAAWGWRWRR